MKKTVLSIIFASLITATSVMMFAGCGNKETSTPDEATTTVATSAEMTTSPTTTVPAVTVPKAVKDLVDKGEIKVDKDGNITDKNGKKVEVKDGKVEVKTDDGKTVTVKVDDVKTTVSNKNNSNKGNTEKKEDTKSNTTKKDNTSSNTKNDSSSSSNNQKPASKPSNSSNNKPASNTTATEAPKYKYYKHHDAVTKYHPAVTKHHDKEWIVTGTHEEPVYDYDWVDVCNNCGQQLVDDNQRKAHLTWELKTNGAGAYHTEKQKVQVGTKTVEDGEWKAAYDEVITPAWTETITPAYDEEVSENDHWDKKVPIN